MSWSYRLATVRGIDLKVHATFAFIVLLAAASWSELGPGGMAFGAGLVLLLFGCVALHEFGHAIAAQRYGIPVREIVLLPIGGVAVLGRATRHPVQELVIAAAGPAVNVGIVAVLAPTLYLLGEPVSFMPAFLRPSGATPSLVEALHWLLGANVGLVLFNLIPAFPLDGGRMLRGLLGLVLDWPAATRWATTTGRTLAVGMGAVGALNGMLMLVVIAVLIFFAAAATEADERAHQVLSTRRVGEACNRHAIALTESDRVSSVVRYLLTSYQPDFAVMRKAQLVGVVRRAQVLGALARRAGDLPVTAVMTGCPAISAGRSLAEARQLLGESPSSVLAVFDGDRFIGLVSAEDLAEAEVVLSVAESAARPDGRQVRPSERPVGASAAP